MEGRKRPKLVSQQTPRGNDLPSRGNDLPPRGNDLPSQGNDLPPGGSPHLPELVISPCRETLRLRSGRSPPSQSASMPHSPAADATRTGRSAVAVSRCSASHAAFASQHPETAQPRDPATAYQSPEMMFPSTSPANPPNPFDSSWWCPPAAAMRRLASLLNGSVCRTTCPGPVSVA